MARQPTPAAAPAAPGRPDGPRPWDGPAGATAVRIAARIADGTYPPGHWLPPQKHIAADLRVRRSTVNLALSELAGKGILTRVNGTGHYPGTGPPPPGKPRPPRNPPPSPPAEQYITVKELAHTLRVSTMTGYRLSRSGDIQGVIRVGRSYRIPRSGAEAYLAAIQISPGRPGPAGDDPG